MCGTIKARFRLALPLVFVVLGLEAAPLWCSEIPKIIYGTWCTTSAYTTSNVQALSRAQAKELVGTTLRFSKAEFQSGTKKFQSPKCEQHRFKAEELVDRFMILPNEIGVTAAFITEIDVRDAAGRLPEMPGQTVLIKSPRESCGTGKAFSSRQIGALRNDLVFSVRGRL
jgi:hypothetical protein